MAEPPVPISKAEFKWADVKRVINTLEWFFLAFCYVLIGCTFGWYLIFSTVALTEKWEFEPWQISSVAWPFGVVSLLSNLFLAPKILTRKGGIKWVMRFAMLIAAFADLPGKINYRETFDIPYLVRTTTMFGIYAIPVSLIMPSFSVCLPRIIAKHGSPFIIGTVSGLTRIFLSIGQALGPILASTMYSFSQSSDSDADRLLYYFATSAGMCVVVCLFGNVVASVRPDFVRDVGAAAPPKPERNEASVDVFEKETGATDANPKERDFENPTSGAGAS